MIWRILLIAGIAVLFYAAFPAIGAFLARSQWRRFRKTVMTVSRYPTAAPSVVSRERASPAGYYRFFGTLEAIQGNDRIWITNGRFSVAADLRNVHIYLIPEAEGSDAEAPAGPGTAGAALGSVPWSRIFSLPEGTPVFVGGALFSEEGRGVFRDNGRTRLLVVIHDCPRENVVLRAISGGRQRNEFMNAFTLPSVCIGSLLLILLAFSLLALPERFITLLALAGGLAPLSPFLPPGVPLYFAYRAYWKKARLLRVQRDVVRLPLRYFPPTSGEPRSRRATLLPDMEPYLMIRGRRDGGDPNVILSEGARIPLPPDIIRIRTELPSRHMRRTGQAAEECVAFSAYTVVEDEVRLLKPEDPMAGQILVSGDPQALALACGRAARFYEVVSGAFIAVDIVVNIPLLFLMLSLLIR